MVKVVRERIKSRKAEPACLQGVRSLVFTVKYHLLEDIDPYNFNTYLFALDDSGDMLGTLRSPERHHVVLNEGYEVEELFSGVCDQPRASEYTLMLSVDRSIDPQLGFHLLGELRVGVSDLNSGQEREVCLQDLPVIEEPGLIVCRTIKKGADWMCEQPFSPHAGGVASYINNRKPKQHRYSEWFG